MAIVLTDAEAVKLLKPELACLLDEKNLPLAAQAELARKGCVCLDLFALMDDDRAGVRQFAKDELKLDPTASVEARLHSAALIGAWEAAKKRVELRSVADAEARAARLPKTMPKAEHWELRKAFEKRYYKLDDEQVPAQRTLNPKWSRSRRET